MTRQSGTWAITYRYSPAVYSAGVENVRGYSDDDPYFGLTSGGSQWSLLSAADGRVMYPNWIGASITPIIDNKIFTPDTPPPIQYDCVNGACLPKTTFNTPGIYATLSECEINCGTGCSGKCLSNEDWAQIEGLAAQLKNKNCS